MSNPARRWGETWAVRADPAKLRVLVACLAALDRARDREARCVRAIDRFVRSRCLLLMPAGADAEAFARGACQNDRLQTPRG